MGKDKGKTAEIKVKVPLDPRRLVRVVPGAPGPTGFVKTQGTKVLLPSGEAIPGVTGIVLRATVDDIWRAEISVIIEPPDVTCLGELVSRQQAHGKWARLWLCIKAIFGPVRHPDAPTSIF